MQLNRAFKVDQRGLMGLSDSIGATSTDVWRAQESNMQLSCQQRGGNWSSQFTGLIPGPNDPHGVCSFPAPASSSPANITVTVPTNVNTQVSPQISPVVQQSSGSGSQTAGTQQGSNPGVSGQDLNTLLTQQTNAIIAAQKAQALLDELARQQEAARAAAAAQAAQAAAAQSAQGIPTQILQPYSPDNVPTMETAPGQTGPIPNATSSPGYSDSMLFLTALGVLAAYLALEPKGKQK